MGVGVAKNGVGVSDVEIEGVELADLGVEATAAAAACKFAMLLCRNKGTPEKALRFDASLSAANCLFHLFRRF